MNGPIIILPVESDVNTAVSLPARPRLLHPPRHRRWLGLEARLCRTAGSSAFGCGPAGG